MTTTHRPRHAARWRHLRRDRRGVALMEFALAFPLVLAMGGYGIELSSFALCNLRVSQYALNLADHASRVGIDAGSGTTQFREADAVDVLQGAKLEGQSIDLTGNGRVTLSSLENVQQSYDSARVQRIHWQRCIGAKGGTGYDSTYGTTRPNNAAVTSTDTAGTGTTSDTAGNTAPTGMGDVGSKVMAPDDSGVMFVEINYLYKPIFGSLYFGSTPRVIHYVASFIVRDNRTWVQITNPSPQAAVMTCNLHTA